MFGVTDNGPIETKNDPTILPFIVGQVSYTGDNRIAENIMDFGYVWYHITIPADHRVTFNVAGLATNGFLMDPSIELHEQGTTNPTFLSPDGVVRLKGNPISVSVGVGDAVENVAVTVRGTQKQYMLAVRASNPPGTAKVGFGNFRLTTIITKVAAVGSNLSNAESNAQNDAEWQKASDSSETASSLLMVAENEYRLGGADANDAEPIVNKAQCVLHWPKAFLWLESGLALLPSIMVKFPP
jgi:hypothetical protein